MSKPSHISADGAVFMVDVSGKLPTARTACAEALVSMNAAARAELQAVASRKGDALVTAQIAGITAAKRTAELIPLAHSLPLAHVAVTFSWDDAGLRIEARATTTAQTGVEMEAMVAASVAALTIYDMAKGIDKSITVERVRLLEKTGGKSGNWKAPA
jgi:cyclic pyranopterin phosphate synthase